MDVQGASAIPQVDGALEEDDEEEVDEGGEEEGEEGDSDTTQAEGVNVGRGSALTGEDGGAGDGV